MPHEPHFDLRTINRCGLTLMIDGIFYSIAGMEVKESLQARETGRVGIPVVTELIPEYTAG
jgi:hypothetical protein